MGSMHWKCEHRRENVDTEMMYHNHSLLLWVECAFVVIICYILLQIVERAEVLLNKLQRQ
jgi:hypothetical protein